VKHKPIPTLTESDLKRFWDKVEVRGPNDCWEWTASTQNKGYGQFGIGGRQGTIYSAHRVSYTIAYDDPGDEFVCHECDNRKCVNPSHLWAGSAKDNTSDALEKKRIVTKLTERDIREIRSSREFQYVIAEKFGVHQTHISRIQRRIAWRHVK
jgi:hypothetical protein